MPDLNRRHTQLSRRRALLVSCLTLSAGLARAGLSVAGPDLQRSWVVTPQAALDLIREGALVLDARDKGQRRWQRSLTHALPVNWEALSHPDLPLKGHLLGDDAVLTQRLRALGVSGSRPVVVAADPTGGWGEEGRIVWTLRALGHTRAVMVDGGIAALRQAGEFTIHAPQLPGDFVLRRVPALEVRKDELKAHLAQPRLVVLDVRERREYDGATPYGETRGGHLPGAQSLWFRELLDKEGRLRPRAEIEGLLAARGATRDRQIVACCSGGIRSAWMVAVLIDMGYTARNYAGSMWEWSAGPATDYPLSTAR